MTDDVGKGDDENEFVHSGEKLRKEEEKRRSTLKVEEPSSTLLWERKNSSSSIESIPKDLGVDALEKDTEKRSSTGPGATPLFAKPTEPFQKQTKPKQTHVLITIAGYLTHDRDDHTYPFSTLELDENGDQYTLIWETEVLKAVL